MPAGAIPLALALALPGAEEGELFETTVRPLLDENCVRCHGATKQKSGLRLDTVEGVRRGGDRGALFVAGKPEESLVVTALSYGSSELQMPPRGKLDDEARAAITEWIRRGAALPTERAEAATAATDHSPGVDRADPFDLAERRRHWAWQPIAAVAPPPVTDAAWPRGEVDRFVLARLEERGLAPALDATRATWLRRVTFDLIGLPPTIAEQDAFLADPRADAAARVVDRLLASPHYGEKWARHWLDLVRYAEGRGHEFDWTIPNAWQYRDYLVRALNGDVSYFQLLREHVAGDLIDPPRCDPATEANESLLGTGFWFLGEAVHSPVDVRGDECDRVANQIDVFSKAFLGVTVACARCHDHKFDAITQRDYYALAGFLAGASERAVPFEAIEVNARVARTVAALRDERWPELKAELPAALRDASERIAATRAPIPLDAATTRVIVDFSDSTSGHAGDWTPDGVAFGLAPLRAGAPRFSGDDRRPIAGFAAIGCVARDAALDRVRTAADSERDPCRVGVLEAGRLFRTRSFELERGRLFHLVRGKGHVFACVSSHRTLEGPLHGATLQSFDTGGEWRWITQELGDYVGQRVHLEFSLLPLDEGGHAPDLEVAMVVEADVAPTSLPAPLPPDLAAAIADLASPSSDAPPGPAMTRFVADQRAQLARMRSGSHVAPAMLEGSGFDEHVLLRGNPKTRGELAPRRFLEAIDGGGPLFTSPGSGPGAEPGIPAASGGSGRLALAARLVDPGNPLVARVAVNRVWHHMFGRGLVATVDDFGLLGERPSDPQLLDSLAARFLADGGSLKRLVRELALSRTYGMASLASAEADAADPDDRLLHRMAVRRLPAEAIRDELLAVSGRLDPTLYGPSVPVHLTPFMDGRGKPADGPLDGNGRRTLYLSVRRNFLDPFLLAFDFPSPATTCGRRSVSNVPAQALALMNGELVESLARRFAERTLAEPATPAQRILTMYRACFARPPCDAELDAALRFLDARSAARGVPLDDVALWSELAHTLFCAKEFLFLP